MPRYLDPKNDFIFKKIFGNHPDLLKSFLNAILPLPEDCVIEKLTYLAPDNVPEIPALKYSIVDVRCFDNHGRHFIVEMQLQWTPDFIKRMIFNAASTYVRQLKKGEEYQDLSPVYGVALLDTQFDKVSPEWFHHFRMAHAVDKNNVLDHIQLILIELPKFQPTTTKDKKLTILWLRFLKEINEKTQEIDPHLLEVAEIKQALTLLEVASYNEEELLAYDQRWDAVSSEKTLLRGKFAEGIVKGRAEGRAEVRTEMVRSLHQLGLSIEQIAVAAKLSHPEIEKILEG